MNHHALIKLEKQIYMYIGFYNDIFFFSLISIFTCLKPVMMSYSFFEDKIEVFKQCVKT